MVIIILLPIHYLMFDVPVVNLSVPDYAILKFFYILCSVIESECSLTIHQIILSFTNILDSIRKSNINLVFFSQEVRKENRMNKERMMSRCFITDLLHLHTLIYWFRHCQTLYHSTYHHSKILHHTLLKPLVDGDWESGGLQRGENKHDAWNHSLQTSNGITCSRACKMAWPNAA